MKGQPLTVFERMRWRRRAQIARRFVPALFFQCCAICNATREEIAQEFPKHRQEGYYVEKFVLHLKTHQVSLPEYCRVFLQMHWPACPVTHLPLGYRISGKGVSISQWPGVGRAELDRFQGRPGIQGGNNTPRSSWNCGLTTDHPYVRKMARQRTGKIVSEATRAKIRLAQANRPPESYQKALQGIARARAAGRFRSTSIEERIRALLRTWGISFSEQLVFGRYSLDFGFPEKGVAIEADGDYFHCNPLRYPSGPINKVQENCIARDRIKETLLSAVGWRLLRYWESDIKAPGFEEILRRDLSALGVL